MSQFSLSVIGPSWPFRSGIARETTLLAAELEAKGSLHSFLVPSQQFPKGLYPGDSDEDPSFLTPLQCAEPCYGISLPHTWRSIPRRLQSNPPKAVVSPYWTLANAPFFTYLCRRSPSPVIAVVHNLVDHEGSSLRRSMGMAALKEADGYFCHSREVQERLKSQFPWKPTEFFPIPPPLESRTGALEKRVAKRNLGIPARKRLFLFAGLIREYKGIEILLEAFAKVSDENDVILGIVGEAWHPSREQIFKWVKDYRLEKRTKLTLNWVSKEEMDQWYTASDVAVLPYLHSFGSGAVATALAHAKPILATNLAPFAEVIGHQQNGLLVPPGDSAALAEGISSFARARSLSEMTAYARRVQKKMTWGEYSKRVIQLADSVSKGTGSERTSRNLFSRPMGLFDWTTRTSEKLQVPNEK